LCIDIILHPENETIATGQTVVLTCEAYDTGTDNLTYQWIKMEKNTLAQVLVHYSNHLIISNASINDSGVYNCVVFGAIWVQHTQCYSYLSLGYANTLMHFVLLSFDHSLMLLHVYIAFTKIATSTD